jgi:hemoglobin
MQYYNIHFKYMFKLMETAMTKSLYERLGGADAVNAAVDIFYRKVLADDRVNFFFEGVDMEKQINKQKGFLTMVFGGPNHYSGKSMRDGHRHLVAKGLNDTHVDAIIELLGSTLKELGVQDADIAEVAAIANSVRDDVLDR